MLDRNVRTLVTEELRDILKSHTVVAQDGSRAVTEIVRMKRRNVNHVADRATPLAERAVRHMVIFSVVVADKDIAVVFNAVLVTVFAQFL